MQLFGKEFFMAISLSLLTILVTSCHEKHMSECNIYIKENSGQKVQIKTGACSVDTAIPALQISAAIDSFLLISKIKTFTVKDSIKVTLIDKNKYQVGDNGYMFTKYKYWTSQFYIYGMYVDGIGTIFLSNDNNNLIRLINRTVIKGKDSIFYDFSILQMKIDSIFAPSPMPNIEELPIDSVLAL